MQHLVLFDQQLYCGGEDQWLGGERDAPHELAIVAQPAHEAQRRVCMVAHLAAARLPSLGAQIPIPHAIGPFVQRMMKGDAHCA